MKSEIKVIEYKLNKKNRIVEKRISIFWEVILLYWYY
jgi:hypothetical protein